MMVAKILDQLHTLSAHQCCKPKDKGCRSMRVKGEVPSCLGRVGEGGKIALFMLFTDIIFSNFILTFVCLSGWTSFYSQRFMTCWAMPHWLEVYVCEK